MNNDPLTHRWKHEARDVNPDPYGWWEGPDRPAHRHGWRWAALLAVATLVVLMLWVPR